MQLIGMLDSPYVRRVAIALQVLGLPFTHRSLSVFRTFDQFRAISPVVKAPSLVCDDGTVLIDSTLILQYAQALAPARQLQPAEPEALKQALYRCGLALATCEKAVQIVYERRTRPEEKQHAPWIERVSGQLQAACDGLEQSLQRQPLRAEARTLDVITIACAWQFAQQTQTVAGFVPAARYPQMVALSAAAEALPEFRAAPHGDGTVGHT